MASQDASPTDPRTGWILGLMGLGVEETPVWRRKTPAQQIPALSWSLGCNCNYCILGLGVEETPVCKMSVGNE